MIDPPIDKLIKKAPARYALVCGLAKRAKELLALETDELVKADMKAITYAAHEIYDGKVKIIVGDK